MTSVNHQPITSLEPINRFFEILSRSNSKAQPHCINYLLFVNNQTSSSLVISIICSFKIQIKSTTEGNREIDRSSEKKKALGRKQLTNLTMKLVELTMMLSLIAPRSVRSFSIASSSISSTLISRSTRRQHRLFSAVSSDQSMKVVNLLTIEKSELEQIVESMGYPKYRAGQIWNWVRVQGVTDLDEMTNIPKKMRDDLSRFSREGSLTLDTELVSKDGTRKRAYRLHDGQLIESVLMPYEDGRYTACISSQAGCAMGCVFCATGQSGFARQLSAEEIFEQVSRFASELAQNDERLSNIVFMGMGEPLANYRNVVNAINRITKDLGIGARKITVSTVGIVPVIRKLTTDKNMPQVRLAVSLHNADDEERSALLPANRRYGGLDELMTALKEYVDTTNRRLTLEWALIEGQNDTPEVARKLGNLVKRYGIRRDMVHVNVIPLNPTGGYGGSPSARRRVNLFTKTVEDEFGISCTPRVRRGIDIDAGCGQLKTKIEKKEQEEQASDPKFEDFLETVEPPPSIGVYEEVFEDDEIAEEEQTFAQFEVLEDAVDFELDDFEDPEYSSKEDLSEAQRLISLVQTSIPIPPKGDVSRDDDDSPVKGPTTTITSEDAVREAKRRRKKLLKNLKAIRKLREMEENGKQLNAEQNAKLGREVELKAELESVEHNLQ